MFFPGFSTESCFVIRIQRANIFNLDVSKKKNNFTAGPINVTVLYSVTIHRYTPGRRTALSSSTLKLIKFLRSVCYNKIIRFFGVMFVHMSCMYTHLYLHMVDYRLLQKMGHNLGGVGGAFAPAMIFRFSGTTLTGPMRRAAAET